MHCMRLQDQFKLSSRRMRREECRMNIFRQLNVSNEMVAFDLMWLDVNRTGKAPVLHIMDSQTHLWNTMCLKGESAKDFFDTPI